ncbi:MAG: MCE family protein [Streptosporangiales bacterium]
MRHLGVRVVAAVTALTMLLGGCSYKSVYDLPLPGGADTGDHPITFSVEFTDVLDLVPSSAVKVGDVTVGKIDRIELVGWHAKVYCEVQGKVHLPDNAFASVRQTSLLGEKYVQLEEPHGQQSVGRLGDGDVIPLANTGRSVEVEEVLAALASLLNGGGLPQLRAINKELNAALSGREDKVKDVIHQLDTFVGGLDEQKKDIDKALTNLNKLSNRLSKQKKTINQTLRKMTPALKVLSDQRKELVTLLKSLSKLGKVAKRVIHESKADLIANLKALRPILTKLAEAGTDLPNAIGMLLTYPFPPNAAGAVKGDYTNLHLTVDLDLAQILEVVGKGGPSNGKLPTLDDLTKLLKQDTRDGRGPNAGDLLPDGVVPTPGDSGGDQDTAGSSPSPSASSGSGGGGGSGGGQGKQHGDLPGLLLGGLL